MHIALVTTESPDYAKALALRNRYLRAPLGLEFTEEERAMDDSAAHFLAFREGELVGCVIGQPQGTEVHIRQMVVTETARGTGVGVQLLGALEAHFCKQGTHHFVLHAREGAVGFYEKQGYIKTGEPFMKLGILHYTLRKECPQRR